MPTKERRETTQKVTPSSGNLELFMWLVFVIGTIFQLVLTKQSEEKKIEIK